MLDQFQKEVLRVIAANRTPDSYIAGGSALNRDAPRLSKDIDVFQKSVALIDAAMERDLASIRQTGLTAQRVRETSTLREWVVTDGQGRSTKIQWTRDTSWLYFPPLNDPEFGFVLSFEDLAINKMAAAADRGRMRDFHDLVALDIQGVRPWLLALACMGKDAELSPPAVLERAIRLLAQAGEDDEDPDYAGPSIPWPAVRRKMERRFRDDLNTLTEFSWMDWAGVLPIDRRTGRMPLHANPADLANCTKLRASPTGSWPMTLQMSSDMLRRASHPGLDGICIDLSKMLHNEDSGPDSEYSGGWSP